MKKYSLTVIRPSDVIEEQSLSMIKGGASAAFCIGNCKKLVVCKPNYAGPEEPPKPKPAEPTEPTDTIG